MRKMYLILLMILAAACGREQPSFDVGMVVSLSGNYAPLLVTARNGALLASEEINQQGNVKINLIVRDDSSRNGVALERSEELVEEGIEYLLMSITSGAYLELEDYINEQDVLVLSPTVSSDEFTGRDDKLIRLTVNISLYAEHLAEYAINQGIKSATIVYDENNLSYADTMIMAFDEKLTTSVPDRQIRQIRFDSKTTPSYIEIAENIRDRAFDSVLIIASPFDTAYICQHIGKSDQLILLSPWGVSKELIENGGRSVEGAVTYLQEGLMDDGPAYTRFVEKYRERFNEEPTYQSMVNYDVLHLLFGVLTSLDSPTPGSAHRFIIDTGRFSGVNTVYLIDEYGDCSFELYPHTIRDGRFVRIE